MLVTSFGRDDKHRQVYDLLDKILALFFAVATRPVPFLYSLR